MCRRRKFRSQPSDFSKDATSPVRRVRGERVRRKKIQAREMLGKSRNAMFFNGSCVRMAQKVGSLKRRVRSHLVERLPESSVPPYSREAHLEVKSVKSTYTDTFAGCKFEKVHTAVARSACGSQSAKTTRVSECTPPWRGQIWKSKVP